MGEKREAGGVRRTHRHDRHRARPHVSVTRQARAAVAAIFLLTGAIFGSWAARIPAIRARVSLSDGELGVALAFIACGAVVAMLAFVSNLATTDVARASHYASTIVPFAFGALMATMLG